MDWETIIKQHFESISDEDLLEAVKRAGFVIAPAAHTYSMACRLTMSYDVGTVIAREVGPLADFSRSDRSSAA